jgi:hypothetical protein
MTTFLQPDEETNADSAKSRRQRDQDRVACFLHLRDLVCLHPAAASAGAVSFVQTLAAKIIAENAAREKRHLEATRTALAQVRGALDRTLAAELRLGIRAAPGPFRGLPYPWRR